MLQGDRKKLGWYDSYTHNTFMATVDSVEYSFKAWVALEETDCLLDLRLNSLS